MATFKCGPDYLDPSYHARTSGATCHNLDGWLMASYVHAHWASNPLVAEGLVGSARAFKEQRT